MRVGRGPDPTRRCQDAGRPAAALVDRLVGHQEVRRRRSPTAAATSITRWASSRTAAHPAPVSIPTPSTRNAPSIRSRAPPRGAGRDSAPPSWRISTNSSSDPEPGPAAATSASTARVRQVGEQDAVGVDRASGPPGRGAAARAEAAGTSSKVSSSGRSARSGASSRSRRARGPRARGVDDDEAAAADVGGQPRHVGGLEQPGDAGDALRRVAAPVGPTRVSTRWAWAQSQTSIPAYAGATGSRSNSSAVTTPKPPPPPRAAHSRSLSSVVGGAHERAVGEDQLDGGERAALQPVRRRVPAQPAAEGGADDADAGAGHVPRGEVDARRRAR